MAELYVCEGDITTLAVDAIVNAANSGLRGGGGVDGAIHRAAGPALVEECRRVRARRGGCPTGGAVLTGAGRLPARHVIHTVGPVWTGRDGAAQDAQLGSCYRASLDLAHDHGLVSLAFPAISTGIYGFPKERAARVAVDAVRGWSAEHPRSCVGEVVFVCFDSADRNRYEELLGASVAWPGAGKP